MKSLDDFLSENNIPDVDSLTAGLKAYYDSKGYTWNDNGIIGMRMSDTYTDEYSDYFILYANGTPIAISGSTKPGSYFLNLKQGGTMKEGQYLEMWQQGTTTWSGRRYLQQVRTCTFYRDYSQLGYIDRNSTVESGLVGCNFHSWKNIGESQKVFNVSEMCQVQDEVENDAAFVQIDLMPIKDYDYTLINIADFLNQNS
jgi:hypothetical protein